MERELTTQSTIYENHLKNVIDYYNVTKGIDFLHSTVCGFMVMLSVGKENIRVVLELYTSYFSNNECQYILCHFLIVFTY